MFSLANLYEAQGQLQKQEHLYQQILCTIKQADTQSSLFLKLTYLRQAALLYEKNQLADAEFILKQASELADDLALQIPLLPQFAQALQSRIWKAKGDPQSIKNDYFPDRIWQTGGTLVRDALPPQATPARIALIWHQSEQAHNYLEARGLRFDDTVPATLTDQDMHNYLALARLLLQRHRDEQNQPAATQAFILLERLLRAIRGTGYHGWSIEVQMLAALVLQGQGKIRRALQMLGPALTQAEAAGYLRLFVDEGQPMRLLLQQIVPYTSASYGYIQRLLQLLPATKQVEGSFSPSPLSKREQEVLFLLAEGLTNQQIADRLIISLNTTKRHVKHILTHLNVISRTQAVIRARQLHFI
jgi:LuxR family maltose regulon positive regulatory protein